MAKMLRSKWWAWQGLNLRPLRCQHTSYCAKAQKFAIFGNADTRTKGEHSRFACVFYRAFTARISPIPHAVGQLFGEARHG